MTVGPLDPAALVEAATMPVGAAPVTTSAPPDGARLVTIGDLGLAPLPQRDTDDCLRWLAEFASHRLTASPITLGGSGLLPRQGADY